MSSDDRIAIVGMSGVYAGAPNVRVLWQNILNKVYAVSDAGPEWCGPYLDPQSKAANRIYTQQGGWLHDLARFDPRAFGVMPTSVDGREPDHFLALQHAHNALQDAGYLERPFNREKAGIILGRGNNVNRGQATLLGHGYFIDQMLEMVLKVRPDFTSTEIDALRDGMMAQLPPLTAEMLPGIIPNVNTGIVANRLNLMGPNFILDAACASALVAVEQASRELLSGRCDLMLAGGVHAQTPPQSYMIFSIINALSRDKIRPFQAGANGTLLGEGCGIIVLKRLSDAERDQDKIYAVIRGTGVASDGKAKGLFAPREEGQVVALKRAYESSGIDPDTISLIEAHATGIALGDRTEIRSLSQLFGPRKGPLPTIAIGSVKSMISHAVPAAGGASLMKTALALRHKVLPPTLCDEVSPELELEKTPFYINTETRPWVHGGKTPRRAGVDAFGFGGINAHVILEEYIPRDRNIQVAVPHAPTGSELLTLAADSRETLLSRIDQLRQRLQDPSPPSLAELACASAGYSQGDHRLAMVVASLADLEKKLEQAEDKLRAENAAPFKTRGGVFYGHGEVPGKVCFIFPGEGAQYTDMLSDVCVQFPQALAWFDALDRDTGELRRADVMFPPPTAVSEDTRKRLESELYAMDHAAESIFAASMALHSVLESIGLQADAMLGHSTGENTALTAARVRRYDDIAEIAQAVSDVNGRFKELDARGAIVAGSLLTLGALKPAQRAALLADPGPDLIVAMDNCPNQLVLFGPPEATGALREKMTAEGVICMELPFGRAYHTALFKPMADAYRDYFQPKDFGPGTTPLYSAYSVGPFPDEPAAIIEHVASQWENRVRFTETVEQLYADGFRVFVEVGPSANLTSFVTDTLRGRDGVIAVASNSRRKPGMSQLHTALAQLYAAGVAFDPALLYAHREVDAIDLALPHAVTNMPVLNRHMPKLHWPDGLPLKPMPAPTERIGSAPEASNTAVVENPQATGTDDPRLQFLQGHFALMQDFLASQARVLQQATGGVTAVPAAPAVVPPTATAAVTPSAPTPTPTPAVPETLANAIPAAPEAATADPDAPASSAFPLLGHVIEVTPQRLVAERQFDVAYDYFLHDHCIGGAPSRRNPALRPLSVVPFTFSMELLAEAAVRLVAPEELRVIGFEDCLGSRWLALDDGRLRVRVIAERKSPLLVSVRVFAVNDPAKPTGILVFEGRVLLARDYPEGPSPMAWTSPSERPATANPRGELYEHGMFHGPRLQGVKHLRRLGDESIDADLEALPTHDYFAFTQTPVFQMDPCLLDCVGQLAGYWLVESFGWLYSCFPFRIQRCSFHAPPPAAGTKLFTRAHVQLSGDHQIAASYDVRDSEGRAILSSETWQYRKFLTSARFYEFRMKPPERFLGRELQLPEMPAGVSVRLVEPFADGFLDDGGAIWKRVLAHMVLEPSEQDAFYALPQAGARSEEWLLGRIAAKEGVRLLVQQETGKLPASADIVIDNDALGRPLAKLMAGDAGAMPAISISHNACHAVAAVAPADRRVGVDYQRSQRLNTDSVAAGGLSSSERELIAQVDASTQPKLIVGLWSAKEAASKAAGTGLQGQPLQWRVADWHGDPLTRIEVGILHHERRYDVQVHVLDDGTLLALCLD